MQVQRQPARKYKSKPIKTLENSLPVGKSKSNPLNYLQAKSFEFFSIYVAAYHENYQLEPGEKSKAHPGKKRYSHQRIFVVAVGEYAYLVPYVENEVEIFLKTIVPSRKATRRYLGDKP